MENCKVNILGTEYKIIFKNIEDDKNLEDADGYTDPSAYEIVVRKNNPNGLSKFEEVQKRALRHECIHAMLFESGLGCNFEHCNKFGHEETMIDWMALQFPKLLSVFQELDLL